MMRFYGQNCSRTVYMMRFLQAETIPARIYSSHMSTTKNEMEESTVPRFSRGRTSYGSILQVKPLVIQTVSMLSKRGRNLICRYKYILYNDFKKKQKQFEIATW